MIETECATTSCSSRAIRARSAGDGLAGPRAALGARGGAPGAERRRTTRPALHAAATKKRQDRDVAGAAAAGPEVVFRVVEIIAATGSDTGGTRERERPRRGTPPRTWRRASPGTAWCRTRACRRSAPAAAARRRSTPAPRSGSGAARAAARRAEQRDQDPQRRAAGPLTATASTSAQTAMAPAIARSIGRGTRRARADAGDRLHARIVGGRRGRRVIPRSHPRQHRGRARPVRGGAPVASAWPTRRGAPAPGRRRGRHRPSPTGGAPMSRTRLDPRRRITAAWASP